MARVSPMVGMTAVDELVDEGVRPKRTQCRFPDFGIVARPAEAAATPLHDIPPPVALKDSPTLPRGIDRRRGGHHVGQIRCQLCDTDTSAPRGSLWAVSSIRVLACHRGGSSSSSRCGRDFRASPVVLHVRLSIGAFPKEEIASQGEESVRNAIVNDLERPRRAAAHRHAPHIIVDIRVRKVS